MERRLPKRTPFSEDDEDTSTAESSDDLLSEPETKQAAANQDDDALESDVEESESDDLLASDGDAESTDDAAEPQEAALATDDDDLTSEDDAEASDDADSLLDGDDDTEVANVEPAEEATEDEGPTEAALASADEEHVRLFLENRYPSANTCGVCHPKHYKEWAVSQHAYAQISPIYLSLNNKIKSAVERIEWRLLPALPLAGGRQSRRKLLHVEPGSPSGVT